MYNPRSLISLATSAVLCNKGILDFLQYLPRNIVFNLTQVACEDLTNQVTHSKNLKELFSRWPFQTFITEALDIIVAPPLAALLASVIQEHSLGRVQFLDISGDGNIGESLPTFLPLAGVKSENADSLSSKGDVVSRSPSRIVHASAMKVVLDVLVYTDNYDEIYEAFKRQKEVMESGDEDSLRLILFPGKLLLDGISSEDALKLVQVMDEMYLKTFVHYPDPDDTNKAALSNLFTKIGSFHELQNLRLFDVSGETFQALTSHMVEQINSLKNIRIFEVTNCDELILERILSSGLQSTHIIEIAILNCHVTKAALCAIISNENLHHLHELEISSDAPFDDGFVDLQQVLEKNASTLLRLNLVGCPFTIAQLKALCPVLVKIQNLEELFFDPRLPVNVIKREIIPMLSELPYLDASTLCDSEDEFSD